MFGVTLIEALGEQLYEETLNKSVINLGCGERLKKILLKDKVRLAFLGASVSCGYKAAPEGHGKAFPAFVEEMFAEKLGREHVEARNRAVSGSDTYTGMLVAQMLMPDYKPDIIFIEYAINEGSRPFNVEKYESFLRMLISFEWQPVVIPVAVFNRDGYSCQEYMLHFSRHYHLPMVGLKDSVYALITSGVLPLDVYTEDEGHPHIDGHEFIAKCIMKTIEQSIEEDEADYPLPEKITEAKFEGIRLLDLEKLTSESCITGECPDRLFGTCRQKLHNGERFIFETECECSYILAMYVKNTKKNYAAVNVFADDKQTGEFSSYSFISWNNPWTELVLSDTEKKLRKVRFETAKGDENKELYLIAVACC